MTFSEFIKTYALEAYMGFCRRNNLVPKIDIKPEPETKICALLKKKPDA